MKYLLDTNALSEPTRKRPSAHFLERLRREAGGICTSVLCVGEMIYGARRLKAGRHYEIYLREVVLPNVPVLDVDMRVATTYGELRAAVERAGRPRSDIDILIAATALCHDVTIVTHSTRDFDGIAGLRVEDWSDRDDPR